MTLTGYDSVTAANLPLHGDLYFGYINGRYTNLSAVKARFPHTRVLSIAVSDNADADVLDVEKFDATPAQAPGWVLRQMALGRWRPVVYANESSMPAVLAALAAAGIDRTAVRVWSAHYTEPHICSPAACGAGFTADATQWAGSPGNSPGPYDITAAVDTFLAPPQPPPPAPPAQEDPMPLLISLQGGGGTVFLVIGPVIVGMANPADAQAAVEAGAKSLHLSQASYNEVATQHAKLIAAQAH